MACVALPLALLPYRFSGVFSCCRVLDKSSIPVDERSAVMAERQRMTTRFKELFAQQKFFVMAGGMNPMGAKMAEVLGSEVFYMSGGNTSAHQLGWPDSGSSMRDMVDNARKIVLTVNIPVFSDADTGYGDAVNTHRTVQEYIQAGIAGCHIEDQTFPPKDRKSTRLNSSHGYISYAVFCLKKKNTNEPNLTIP